MAQQENQKELPLAAPLPMIAGRSAASTSENPWQPPVLRFSVDCGDKRLKRTHSIKEGRIIPSRFRRGEIQIDTEGMHFTGVGGQPLVWLRRLSITGGVIAFCAILYYIYYVNTASGPSMPLFFGLISTAMVGATVSLIATLWNDRRTVPITLTVPWEAVTQLHIKSQMRWAKLLYESHRLAGRTEDRIAFGHLPIMVSTPSEMAALADFAEKFIGERVQRTEKK